MRRFFGRRLAFDLAATLLVVLVSISVGDIDDYDMHSQATLAAFDFSARSSASPEAIGTAEDPGSLQDHHCSCTLCVMTIPDSLGPRMAPPSPGKLSAPRAAAAAASLHPSEIYRPPPA